MKIPNMKSILFSHYFVIEARNGYGDDFQIKKKIPKLKETASHLYIINAFGKIYIFTNCFQEK